MDFEKLSRRSFLKKTTALTVGISSLTMLAGLADEGYNGYLNKQCNDARIQGDCVYDPTVFGVGYKCIVFCGTVMNGSHYYAWCAGPYKVGGNESSRNIQCKEYATEYN